MRLSRLLFVVPVVLAVAACASSSGSKIGAPPAEGGETCRESARAASAKVQAVIDASSTCTTDADCVVVAFQTTCFDACTRVVAKSGQASVSAAEAQASANECQPFTRAGCHVTPPPCAPPLPASCQAGRCSG